MLRLAKIALILVTAALVIAAGRGVPLETRNPAVPAVTPLPMSLGDMMRYSGPIPKTQVDSVY